MQLGWAGCCRASAGGDSSLRGRRFILPNHLAPPAAQTATLFKDGDAWRPKEFVFKVQRVLGEPLCLPLRGCIFADDRTAQLLCAGKQMSVA